MKADYIFNNGSVITVNKQDEIVESVAVKDNMIVFVGNNEDSKVWIGKDTQIINLDGKTLMPGFIDSHMHGALGVVFSIYFEDINYKKCPNIQSILDVIQKKAAAKTKGEWLYFNEYDQSKLEECRHITREELNRAAPDHPVIVNRCCGHMGIFNDAALKIIKETNDLSKFEESEVNLEEGMLKEAAHSHVWMRTVEINQDIIMDAIKLTNNICLKKGITSYHDALVENKINVKGLQKIVEKGINITRVYLMICNQPTDGKVISDFVEGFLTTGLYTGIGNNFMKLGPVKVFIDGSTSGPSAMMREPFCHDPNLKGSLRLSQEQLDEVIMTAHKSNYQVTVHAVGDKAIIMALDAMEKALEAYPRDNHRHRIEHCGFTDPEIITRIKRLSIIPVSNPAFFTKYGKAYNKYYGDRVDYMFAVKSYIDSGIISTIGSDYPVVDHNPMLGLYGAVARKDLITHEIVGAKQRVDLLDAIRLYTYNGAYAAFDEDRIGSIEVGKLADMIVLSENILNIETEDILKVEVNLTMVDGVIVYQKNS